MTEEKELTASQKKQAKEDAAALAMGYEKKGEPGKGSMRKLNTAMANAHEEGTLDELIAEMSPENARLRDVLKRIAEHGCGCDPVCVCLSEGHIRIELDEKISLAKEALKATE